MSTHTQTHYELLGVRDDADIDVIKASYRTLIRKFHPDVAGISGAEMTSKLNHALDELSDPARRDRYDLTIRPRIVITPTPAPQAAPRRADPVAPQSSAYERARDKFEEYETSIPWSAARSAAWSRILFFSFFLVIATAVMLTLYSFNIWTSGGQIPGLSIPVIIGGALVAFLPAPPTLLRASLIVVISIFLAALLGFPSLGNLDELAGLPVLILVPVFGIFAFVFRVALPRAREMWRLKPTE